MPVIVFVKFCFFSRSQRKLHLSTYFISLKDNSVCTFRLSREASVRPNIINLIYTVWKYSVSSWQYSSLLSDKNRKVGTHIF